MEKHLNRFSNLIINLKKQNLTNEEITNFILTNLDILDVNLPILTDRINFLYNNQEIYCILLVLDDNYAWSLKEDNIFQPFKWKKNENGIIINQDAVVDTIMDLGSQEKIQRTLPEIVTLSLVQRCTIFKKIGLNSQGYNLK